MISESGGFTYANNKLNEFSEKSIDAIQKYEESEIKKSLIELVSFNIKRTR
jgi:geranylgeranyl pyrophosphate synthase